MRPAGQAQLGAHDCFGGGIVFLAGCVGAGGVLIFALLPVLLPAAFSRLPCSGASSGLPGGALGRGTSGFSSQRAHCILAYFPRFSVPWWVFVCPESRRGAASMHHGQPMRCSYLAAWPRLRPASAHRRSYYYCIFALLLLCQSLRVHFSVVGPRLSTLIALFVCMY